MAYKKFEEHLNKSLNNRDDFNIDNEAMWEELRSALPEKKKKRRFAFWWFFGLVTLLIGAAYLVMEPTAVEVEDGRLTSVEKEAKAKTKKTFDDTVNKSSKSNDESHALQNEITASVENPQKEKAEINDRRVEGKESTTQHVVSTKKVTIEASDNRSQVLFRNKLDVPYKELEGDEIIKLSGQNSQAKIKTEKEEGIKVLETMTNQGEDKVEEEKKVMTPRTNEVIVEDIVRDVNEAKVVEDVAEDISSNDESLNKVEQDNENEAIPKQDLRKWGLGLTAGYYIPSAEYGVSNTGLTRLRQQEEEPLEAFDFSLTVEYKLSSRWSVSSGILYSQINQSALNVESFLEDRLGDVTVANVRTLNGNYVLTNMSLFPHEIKRWHRRYVSYASLAIPMVLRYNQGISERWAFVASAGMELSLMSWQAGYEQDLDNMEYDLSTDLSKRTRRVSSHYLLFGLRIEHLVSEKMTFHLGSHTKYAISDLYQTTDFQKRYLLPGLSSGVIINF